MDATPVDGVGICLLSAFIGACTCFHDTPSMFSSHWALRTYWAVVLLVAHETTSAGLDRMQCSICSVKHWLELDQRSLDQQCAPP